MMTKARLLIFFVILFDILHLCPVALAKSQLKINKIIFEGNSAYSDRRLARLILTGKSGFLSRTYYYSDILNDDIANIILFYQNNGYLEVRIDEPAVSIDSARQEVSIEISISEGELTRTEGVSVFGNTVFGDSILLHKVKLKEGEPFKRNRVHEGMLDMLSLYADQGYLDAIIKPEIKISYENHLAVVDLMITENARAVISDIRISGLEKTREYVIRRELSFKRGDVVIYSRLLNSQKRLYLTGLFESVFIRPIQSEGNDPGEKTILVEIKEKLSGEVNVALGYGSVDRIRGRLEVLNNNLIGTGRQIGMSLTGSFIRRAVEASFSEPWTLGLKLKSDLNLVYEYLEEPGYDMGRLAARLTLGRTLRKNSHIELTYRFEEADLKNVEIRRVPASVDSRTRSLMLSLVYDTRDNLFNPKTGKYIEWANELAGAFLRGNNTFIRSVLKIRGFYSYNPQTILASSIEIGWMDYFGASDDIPLNERFYAGGPNSIRGFGYQLVGPLESKDVPLGGRFKLVWNAVEIRRTIYKFIGGALFIDLGNVWPNIRHFNIADIRLSGGPGLRANTPIGLLRLDYGINFFPEDYESSTQLHFNIGHSF